MQRIAIIGSPGTGKSTFARELTERTGLPLIHLDYYYHDPRHDFYRDKIAWRAKADALADTKQWIIDGNFGATMARRLQRADTIFYFDMPTSMALLGIMKRWITAHKTVRPDMPDGWREKPSLGLFWKVVWFRHKYTRDTRTLLEQNQDKSVIVFRNHRQINDYLSRHPAS